jgi:hypothetical protein
MAKTYISTTNAGSHPPTAALAPTSPPASGPVMVRIWRAADGSTFFGYSGNVDGSKTFYVVDNGPTLGRQYSAS